MYLAKQIQMLRQKSLRGIKYTFFIIIIMIAAPSLSDAREPALHGPAGPGRRQLTARAQPRPHGHPYRQEGHSRDSLTRFRCPRGHEHGFQPKACTFGQCSESGIRCLFDPWIWDPGWVKIRSRIRDPDPG
jgi:hypothetical protein